MEEIMVNLLLFVAVLVLAAGLGVQICITSWNIRRANRYQRQRNAAESQSASMKDRVEHTSEKFRSLDKYATDISWLLRFLYNRYDKFADIDREIEEGSAGKPPEADKQFLDLKRAIKIVKVTVRASEKIESFMGSIATQISSIVRDLEEADEEEPAEKKDEAKAPESTDTPASTAEPATEKSEE